MSVFSQRRKERLRQLAGPPPLDPREDLTIRVAHRICAIVYSRCDCGQRGLMQVCDVMRSAAQHAMQEILK
jgi:hypothetical protein